MKKILHHARLVMLDGIHEGSLVLENGLITKIFLDCHELMDADERVDCQGLYLSPGFVDIHLHGGGGADFMDGLETSVETVLKTHARHGTTAFLPSTLSNHPEKVIKALQAIQNVQDHRQSGPKILGAHLESNFFSRKQSGAQDPAYIFPPTAGSYENIVNAVSNIRMISCAPELENCLNFADEMHKRGIVLSAAHSDATWDEFTGSLDHGFSHVTHIFNGNSMIHSPYFFCQVGVCEAGLYFDKVCVEVIADGCHLPKELLRLIYKIKGAEAMNLCTDAMRAADMPPGTYRLGELDVIVTEDVAMLPDRSSLAGSICSSDRAVRTMVRQAGVPLHDAVKMITATPAKLLGAFDKIGSITVGKAADLNLFDDDINIKYTLIDGQIINNRL